MTSQGRNRREWNVGRLFRRPSVVVLTIEMRTSYVVRLGAPTAAATQWRDANVLLHPLQLNQGSRTVLVRFQTQQCRFCIRTSGCRRQQRSQKGLQISILPVVRRLSA